MSRRALVLVCLTACSSKGGQPRGAPADAAVVRAAPDAMVAVAVVPDAAPPPAPCLPDGNALALAFDGTTATICTDYDPTCVAVTEDGRVAAAELPDDVAEPFEVTIDEAGKTVAVCAPGGGACKKLAPKLKRGRQVARAEVDPSGRYVLLDTYGDFGDPTVIEVWELASAKKRASQTLPFDDDEGETLHVEWAGSLIVLYWQPGPQVPGRGTVYRLEKSKLTKVKDLPGLTAWATLDDQALFLVADGPKVLAFHRDTGTVSGELDASWLDEPEGVYALAAGDGKIAVLADASAYDPPSARLGFVSTKTVVDLPICPTR